MNRLDRRSHPLLYFAVIALVAAVFLADLMTPLGIAVWIFYLVPLALGLAGRSPMLPLYVAAFATVATALKQFSPFSPGRVVAPWIGYTNRSMYAVTLWFIAYMVRRLILARLATEREEWIRRVHTGTVSSLLGELSVAEVARRALRSLLEALDGAAGAAYLTGPGGSERVAVLGIAGEGTPPRFAPGEGLIGRVMQEGRAQILSEVPEGFLRLETGIGAGPPKHVAIAPFRSDGGVVGAVALGSVHRFDENAQELLERLAEPIGVALVSSQYKARLRELLEESQRQAEELQSQQAELEAQQAGMEAANEELNQTNALMEVQTRELEAQRDALAQARQTAEQANRYKSEFLANMSHELRTPLNSSLILARLLADNKEGNLTPDQVQSARTIYNAGNDLLSLINDILDLSKIESGRSEVAPGPVGLGRLATSLEQAFAPVAADKRLTLRIRVEDGCPDTIFTDGRRLEQILKNLLSNALKFTERGEVELWIRAEPGDRIRFDVRDSGIGIPVDQQEVIFEAFRQADGTTSRRYGGTGLGLSISRELAGLLGGSLTVDSAPGRGSTFSLLLPREADFSRTAVAKPPSASPPAKAGVAEPPATKPSENAPARRPVPALPDDRDHRTHPGRLILVVEDDLPFARILLGLAHDLGFDCVIATGADEGLALARELQPSGILLDVGLPDASGLLVLERLKRDPTTRHLPVHMISASDNAQTALALGAVGYALKPVAREQLVAAISKLEEQRAREVRRVLVVEDDLRQQEGIRKLLEGQSIELVAVGSVKDALSKLESLSFDCMILDLTLPDGSGYDLLEKMAEGVRYSFPPVIVYTGRDLERGDEERLRRYSSSIIIKGARSPERLLDEVMLFLHQVESTLPRETRRMLADARQREAVFERRRILVVEDDVRNVFALSKVLEPRGAKVEIARNGREALDLLERASKDGGIDLVLMDLMMPEMDGLTAMRAIRQRDELKRLPIIALTAKAMPDDREQALAAGANDYISKPIDVDKLLSLCRVWLPR